MLRGEKREHVFDVRAIFCLKWATVHLEHLLKKSGVRRNSSKEDSNTDELRKSTGKPTSQKGGKRPATAQAPKEVLVLP